MTILAVEGSFFAAKRDVQGGSRKILLLVESTYKKEDSDSNRASSIRDLIHHPNYSSFHPTCMSHLHNFFHMSLCNGEMLMPRNGYDHCLTKKWLMWMNSSLSLSLSFASLFFSLPSLSLKVHSEASPCVNFVMEVMGCLVITMPMPLML